MLYLTTHSHILFTVIWRQTYDKEPFRLREEGIKEMFYLTTNSTHLRLYGIRHTVKDHSNCERGRNKGNVLFNDKLNTFTVIWHQTYGKGPFR